MKKYSLTKEKREVLGKTLYRIKAERTFGDVKKEDLGGFVEKEENLSHEGDAWVSGDAWVYDNARVYGDAWVYGDAEAFGNARVYGDTQVYGNARVFGEIKLTAGSFFGNRVNGEDINYLRISDTNELIYKGKAEFGEVEEDPSGRKVTVEIDGKKYEAVIS
jgi:hypothetical protein